MGFTNPANLAKLAPPCVQVRVLHLLFFSLLLEKHKFITQTNRAEKWSTFVILSFILIVAAFNILASLTMLLIDKKEDLFIFNAMGFKNKDIDYK